MIKINDHIYTYDYDFKMGAGVYFPARCTIVKDGSVLTLISPGPFHEAVYNQIHTLGVVKHIIAPNCFHHVYVNTALRNFPEANLYMPKTLNKKYPGKFLEESKNLFVLKSLEGLTIYSISGHKLLSEIVFYHEKSKTLILTDLIFNIQKTKNLTSKIFFTILGVKGKPKMSPLLKLTIKDRKTFYKDLKVLLNLDINNIVMAHGDPITNDANSVLKKAWRL